MSVHYKFKSALEYDTVTFDGLHISVKDLKNAIVQQKRIGKNTDFDLQVTNAQTKEVYDDDNVLIPKNTSLLIARIPTSSTTKNKQWEGYGGDATPPTKLDEGGPIAKAVDLSSLDAPEGDKIKAMISQSTQDYDPSNYMKIRGANQVGAVPPNYRCYKCHQMGHWIKDCPLSKGPEPIEIKKSTGIPLSFMVPVEGPQVQGAMMTPNGSYAVPVLDHQTYTQKQAAPAPVQEMKPEIPEDLLCSICSDLLTDAVMIPCCGNSFCDECIRSILLESEEHECPDCHEKDISPVTLIPNRFLRNSVSTFKNTTGYVKTAINKQIEPPVKVKSKEIVENKVEIEEKTVISEADSTEPKSEEKEIVKEVGKTEVLPANEGIPEGPPGVSPVESPKRQPIAQRVNSTRIPLGGAVSARNNVVSKPQVREESPRRQPHRSPPYQDNNRNEERPGTPTVDEPGMGNPPQVFPPADVRPYQAPPIMGVVPQMQAPPPGYPPTFPPTNGPPPNFRLPPPGAAPPPYIAPPGYQVPPRPMYDTSRPPMTGPPPPSMYNAGYAPGGAASATSRSHHHSSRDYGMDSRRMRGRTPSGVIDDPLAAFNRMLREKDERERRAKQRNQRRSSYSRSRSRSRSYSPRSPRRMRSRSPRRRSRSRSFSISRSRSRSFSGSPFRDFSPRHSPPRRRGPSRYRSPIRSPPRRRFKESHPSDHFRDRDHHHHHHRDYERGYSRDREHTRSSGGGGGVSRNEDRERERERDYGYYDSYDDRNRKTTSGNSGNNPMSTSSTTWNRGQSSSTQLPPPPQNDNYHYHHQAEMQQPYPTSSRYPPRDYIPHYGTKPDVPPSVQPPIHIIPPNRRFDDVAPPGVEEPPVPGLETAPPSRYDDQRYDRPPLLPPPGYSSPTREREKLIRKSEERKRRRSRSVEKSRRSPSVGRIKEKSRERESPEKHKKKKRDNSSDREKKGSEDEKGRKTKDRKKKKDKKDSDKKKRKEKKEKHRKDEKKHKEEVKEDVKKVENEEEKEKEDKEKKIVEEIRKEKEEEKEEKKLVKNEEITKEIQKTPELRKEEPFEEKISEEPIQKPEDFDDSGELGNILEIHPNDIDLKTELDVKNEMLSLLPEKSKWEVDEDPGQNSSPKEKQQIEIKTDKTGAKVTNEVLKRAENAIFAKAINAIRPIEIKKISTDRAKLYSDEKEIEEDEDEEEPKKNEEEIETRIIDKKPPPVEIQEKPVRLSVKERLGVKIDDDRIVKVDRNKSRSLSPFSRRTNDIGRNYGQGERRVEVVDRRRRERERSRPRSSRRNDYRREERRDSSRRNDKREHSSRRDEKKKDRKDLEREKPRRRSSDSEDRRSKSKKKDRKIKKDKPKEGSNSNVKKTEENVVVTINQKKKEDEEKEKVVVKTVDTKRKPTIDEASFEPDYDLETDESDKDEKKKDAGIKEKVRSSSSSDSSDSSSDDDKKKKKHKKHRKSKRSRKETSSSSSDSETDSSDDDKDRKRKKHKKKQKKKKKSKHK